MSEKMMAQFTTSTFQEETAQAIQLLVDTCKLKGIPLYVFLFGTNSTNLGKTYHDFYSREFTKYGVKVESFPDALYSPQNRNSLIDSHPNHLGLTIMTEFIYSKIRSRLTKF
jgi:hypothetical protein